MTRRCAGTGLMVAGLIVTLVGLAAALTAAVEIPPYWTTALIGAALFSIGALRWAIASRHHDPGSQNQ